MTTVLLVHGIYDTGMIFRRLIRDLNDAGFRTLCPDLRPNDASVPMEEYARQIADVVERQVDPTDGLAMVGFSMGGLVARHYLQFLDGWRRAKTFISIACPHYGTLTAYLRGGMGVSQMRPGSKFLRSLQDTQDRLAGMELIACWTPMDLMIIPAWHCRWQMAENHIFPALAHSLMLIDGRCRQFITRRLKKARHAT